MNKIRSNPIMLIILLVVCAVAVYAYVKLPADGRYPVHWNISGQPDRYGSKLEAVSIGPIVSIMIYALAVVMPALDPKEGIMRGSRGSTFCSCKPLWVSWR